ncbi:MAG TPA: RES family NAD+ phosphorylase [Opitutaceae bacterium]
MSAARRWRSPPAQDLFDAIALTPKLVPGATWINLRWSTYATTDTLFFPGATARLTPDQGKVSCLYLAPRMATSFAELYGDALFDAHQQRKMLVLERVDLDDRVFLEVDLTDVQVCDLTDPQTVEDMHFDLSTIYATDVAYPRSWAKRIHEHPARFDGIRYESRHDKQSCLVVWPTYRTDLSGCVFRDAGRLADFANTTFGPSGAPASDLFGHLVKPVE